jgi:hypothetical protein
LNGRRGKVSGDTVKVGGYTLHIPGYDELTPTQQMTLKGYVTLVLQEHTAPSQREVLEWIINQPQDETDIKSAKSVQAVAHAASVLTALKMLKRIAPKGRRPRYWPICLRVLPRAEFVVSEE